MLLTINSFRLAAAPGKQSQHSVVTLFTSGQDLPSDTIIRFPLERVRAHAPHIVYPAPQSEADCVRAPDTFAPRPERKVDRIPRWVRRWLFRANVPGAIRDIELHESLTGRLFSVFVGEYFVCVRVDGDNYYFDRITGRFNGVGGAHGWGGEARPK